MGFQRHKTFASRTRTHANRPSDMFSLRWRGGAGGGFDEGSRRSRFPACGGGAWEDWCLRAVLRERTPAADRCWRWGRFWAG